MDGTRIDYPSTPSDPTQNERTYSGEKRKHRKKMVFVVDPFGKIVEAVWNVNGDTHDSRAAWYGRLYTKINNLPAPYQVLADRAFKGGVSNLNKVVRSLRRGEKLPLGMTQQQARRRDSAITSGCQPNEWTNRDLKGCLIRRLNTKLIYSEYFNSDIMELSMLLHNLRVERLERNQVQKFFQMLKEEHHEDDQLSCTSEATTIASGDDMEVDDDSDSASDDAMDIDD